MGGCEHLLLDSAWAAYTPGSPEDAETQCNRGVADDVENRLAEMPTTNALNRNTSRIIGAIRTSTLIAGVMSARFQESNRNNSDDL